MAVFGAIVMYIMSMLSLFKLRKTEPNLERTSAHRATHWCRSLRWCWRWCAWWRWPGSTC
jgi:amino acid transporter